MYSLIVFLSCEIGKQLLCVMFLFYVGVLYMATGARFVDWQDIYDSANIFIER